MPTREKSVERTETDERADELAEEIGEQLAGIEGLQRRSFAEDVPTSENEVSLDDGETEDDSSVFGEPRDFPSWRKGAAVYGSWVGSVFRQTFTSHRPYWGTVRGYVAADRHGNLIEDVSPEIVENGSQDSTIEYVVLVVEMDRNPVVSPMRLLPERVQSRLRSAVNNGWSHGRYMLIPVKWPDEYNREANLSALLELYTGSWWRPSTGTGRLGDLIDQPVPLDFGAVYEDVGSPVSFMHNGGYNNPAEIKDSSVLDELQRMLEGRGFSEGDDIENWDVGRIPLPNSYTGTSVVRYWTKQVLRNLRITRYGIDNSRQTLKVFGGAVLSAIVCLLSYTIGVTAGGTIESLASLGVFLGFLGAVAGVGLFALLLLLPVVVGGPLFTLFKGLTAGANMLSSVGSWINEKASGLLTLDGRFF